MLRRSERIFSALPADVRPDAVLLLNGGANFVDNTFRYVSGVTRGGYEGCTAVLRPGERPQLAVSALEEQSAQTASGCDVHAFRTRAAQGEILKTLVGEPHLLGLNAPAVAWDRVRAIRALFPDAELVDVSDAIAAARLVKDDDELERMRVACAITSDVAAEIPSMLREGMTELDLSADVASAMQRRGGQVAFSTIVCFGKNGAEPHYSPGETRLRRGDMILVDFGAKRNDYCADITRMYLYGRASAEQRRMFDVVLDAQHKALDAVIAGAVGRDVHRRATEVIDATEFTGRFIHGLGHSIGLDVHDGAGLNDASTVTLEPGMVFTVEPGVYVPGVGGVRIEDTVVVTANGGGPEILTPVTKELVEVDA